MSKTLITPNPDRAPLMPLPIGPFQDRVAVLQICRWFYNEVCERAETRMAQSHKLEGAHYASMTALMTDLSRWAEQQQHRPTPEALEMIGWTRTVDSGETSMHLGIPNGPTLTASFSGQTFIMLKATMSAPMLDADGFEQEDSREIDFPNVVNLGQVIDVAVRLMPKVVSK